MDAVFGFTIVNDVSAREVMVREKMQVMAASGLGTALELRLDPQRAERHRLFDPVTVAVSDRATLGAWDEHLLSLAVLRSLPAEW